LKRSTVRGAGNHEGQGAASYSRAVASGSKVGRDKGAITPSPPKFWVAGKLLKSIRPSGAEKNILGEI